jgi:hypothetical protein
LSLITILIRGGGLFVIVFNMLCLVMILFRYFIGSNTLIFEIDLEDKKNYTDIKRKAI